MSKLLSSLDPVLLFKNLEERKNARENASDVTTLNELNPDKLSWSLHPEVQYMTVAGVKEYKGAKTFRLIPDKEKGSEECALFLPGQYVSVYLDIYGTYTSRPYSLSSTPSDALKGFYEITVKSVDNGFVSSFILSTWSLGTKVVLSGPQGQFTYNPIRDTSSILCIAGGSGITPFMSFVKSLKDKVNITLLYGSRKKKETLFFDELEEMNRNSTSFKCVFVFSDEKEEGYEHGFISASIINKYMAPNSRFFICGPEKMIKYVDNELSLMGVETRRIRHDAHSVKVNGPSSKKRFEITVFSNGEEKVITASEGETILTALERSGIKAPSSCRSGECGFCRALLRNGNVFIPPTIDKRRRKDKDYGYIHPCITYPMGNIEIEIFPPSGLYKEKDYERRTDN